MANKKNKTTQEEEKVEEQVEEKEHVEVKQPEEKVEVKKEDNKRVFLLYPNISGAIIFYKEKQRKIINETPYYTINEDQLKDMYNDDRNKIAFASKSVIVIEITNTKNI